jgi:hypothetical protein
MSAFLQPIVFNKVIFRHRKNTVKNTVKTMSFDEINACLAELS